MATWNGFLCSTAFGTTDGNPQLGATASQTLNVSDAVPMKYFTQGIGAIRATQGISRGFGVQVIGAVGGATFVIAGKTSITTAGNHILGFTGIGGVGIGFPRPSTVVFEPVNGTAGFTAAVYLTGEYD